MDFEGFPLIIGWELTLACNLFCEHCSSSAGLVRPNELTLEEALAVCEQFPELLVHEVLFTGGEPLFRPDWVQIATRLRDLKIKTRIVTNGLLLGPKTIEQIKDTGIERVGISIDGVGITHDRIRKCSGLFRHILVSIDQLLKTGIPVTAITTVSALNIKELPDLFSLFGSIGVDIWQVQPILPLGRARDCEELILSGSAYMQFGCFTKAEATSIAPGAPTISPGDSFGYFTELDRRQPAWGGCSAGLDLCGITSDGRIKGCLSMPDELADADLRQRNLWDIWFDPGAFRYNREFTVNDLGVNCRSCKHGQCCRGGCSSMSYACTGQLHNNPYCFFSMQK
jgi:radical SAM protein with 4Fe4S-binding SPASM domain